MNNGPREEAVRIARKYLPDDATDGEIGELLDAYVKDRIRNLPAFLTKQGPDGRLNRDLESYRNARRAAANIRQLDAARQEPECEHGTPGGRVPHPETGLPLCPICRADSPAGNFQEDNGAQHQQEPDSEPFPDRRMIFTPASEITPRPVLWGWQDRLPTGTVSLIAGREGIGKSLFLIDLTAQLTRGTLPGVFYGSPRGVVYCATEDSWQHTIAPRLIAAGADLERVFRAEVETIEATTGTSRAVELSLPRDCEQLAVKVKEHGVAMIALDPLMSAVDRTVDTHNDREMRTVLEPLAQLADGTGCVVAGLAHFNKSGDSDPLNLIMGSRAFTAVVRAVLAIARDPDADDGRCVISQVKNNLGRLDLSNLGYVIRSAAVPTADGDAHVGRLEFIGESDRSVSDILADAGSPSEQSARASCIAWLRETLTEPKRSVDLEDEAKELGHASRTVKRARAKLGIRAEKRADGWYAVPPGLEEGHAAT